MDGTREAVMVCKGASLSLMGLLKWYVCIHNVELKGA